MENKPIIGSFGISNFFCPKDTEHIYIHKSLYDVYDGLQIFRYISWNRLLTMLTNRSLAFSHFSAMSDERDSVIETRKLAHRSMSECLHSLTIVPGENDHLRKFIELESSAFEMVTHQYISCWTKDLTEHGTSERYLMWRAYERDKASTIRIGTTLNALVSSLRDFSGTIIISPVKYHKVDDFHIQDTPFNVFRKIEAYSDEQEIRFLYVTDSREQFITIPVETLRIFKSIVLSPFVADDRISYYKNELKKYEELKDCIIKESNIIEKL